MSGNGFSVGSSGYDDEDRLVNWQRSDTNLDQSWNLSAVGNWNSITENSSSQNRTHGPTHELLTVASQSVTHDAKGDMTLFPAVLRPSNSGLPPTASRLSWDFENKLIAADTDNDSMDDIFYKFDALGRRVGRDDGTANVVYFQDGQQTIADYPSGTAASSSTYTYVYASYIDEPVVRGGSGGLRYYHRNQQYSITALTDGGGSIVERYAYTAYGQVTFADATGTVQAASASNNRYASTGREWDDGMSLYHYRARMYDAVAGRFCSSDPIVFLGGGPNLFEYVGSQPTKGQDPEGLKWSKRQYPPGSGPHTIFSPIVWPIVEYCLSKKPTPCSCVASSTLGAASQSTPTPIPGPTGGMECTYSIPGTMSMTCSAECFGCYGMPPINGAQSSSSSLTVNVTIPVAGGATCPSAAAIGNQLPPSVVNNPPSTIDVEIVEPDGTIIGALPFGPGSVTPAGNQYPWPINTCGNGWQTDTWGWYHSVY